MKDSLCATLRLENNLPMIWLDALVILQQEGMSIYRVQPEGEVCLSTITPVATVLQLLYTPPDQIAHCCSYKSLFAKEWCAITCSMACMFYRGPSSFDVANQAHALSSLKFS